MVTALHPDVSVTQLAHVGVVEIHRPPHNYFDAELVAGIAAAITTLDAAPECRAMVLVSEGRCFCAGADFTGPSRTDPGAVYRSALPIFRRHKPLVAAIQGPAIGGGLGLALSADFRVAAPEARFQANFVRIGLHPGFGLTHTLARVIGTQAAANLFLTGRRVDGAEALQLGLADKLVALADLRAAAIEYAEIIGAGAPLAIQSIQTALTQDLAGCVEKAMSRELAAQEALFKTADFVEGVRASAERRAPRFTGT